MPDVHDGLALGAHTADDRVSQRIGGLPYVAAVWDRGPLVAATAMLVVDFGLTCALMYIEGIPPWEREHYQTFLWNDTLIIPLYMAVVVLVLRGTPATTAFYTERWWHWLLLGSAFALSLLIEAYAVQIGQYTMSQELSPSKLWHTFIFGIVGYWLMSTLLPVMLTPKPRWAAACLLIAVIWASYNVYRDATIRPFPSGTHLEGSYIPWRWAPRS